MIVLILFSVFGNDRYGRTYAFSISKFNGKKVLKTTDMTAVTEVEDTKIRTSG